MRKIIIHIILSLITTQVAIAQQSKNNLSAAAGISYPYSPKPYNTPAFNGNVEYVLMFNPNNGIAFQIDIVKFRNKERQLQTEFRSISIGHKHRFTEKFFTQLSLGGSSFQSNIGQSSFLGMVEIKTGLYFPGKNKYGYEFSLFMQQTTGNFGWIGLQAALMLSFESKKKK
jgi:hypothetical protein